MKSGVASGEVTQQATANSDTVSLKLKHKDGTESDTITLKNTYPDFITFLIDVNSFL